MRRISPRVFEGEGVSLTILLARSHTRLASRRVFGFRQHQALAIASQHAEPRDRPQHEPILGNKTGVAKCRIPRYRYPPCKPRFSPLEALKPCVFPRNSAWTPNGSKSSAKEKPWSSGPSPKKPHGRKAISSFSPTTGSITTSSDILRENTATSSPDVPAQYQHLHPFHEEKTKARQFTHSVECSQGCKWTRGNYSESLRIRKIHPRPERRPIASHPAHGARPQAPSGNGCRKARRLDSALRKPSLPLMTPGGAVLQHHGVTGAGSGSFAAAGSSSSD